MAAPQRSATTARILLVRHGETEWSKVGRHTGRTDIDLTDLGEQQARALSHQLEDRRFGLVLASPLKRAQRTAQLAGIQDFDTDPDLAEWDYGIYEGRTTEEITADYGSDWLVWEADGTRYPMPGESVEQLGDRADKVLRRLAPFLDAGEDVLLVAHGHVLRALAARWIGLPARSGAAFTLSTATLSELGFAHGRHAILAWNAAVLRE